MIQANEEKTKMYAPIYDEFGMEVGTKKYQPICRVKQKFFFNHKKEKEL